LIIFQFNLSNTLFINIKKEQFKCAFTLAEVLVTLAIIGVVAALTVPQLILNTQDHQLKVAWKKAYSSYTLAANLLMEENAGTFQGLCTSAGATCIRDKFLTKLSYIAKCDSWSNASSSICFPTGIHILDGTLSTWNGESAAALNDGSSALFYWYYPNCDNANYNPCGSSGTADYCGFITVDVNGFAPPNIFGKDIFQINIHKHGIKPCDTGAGCSAGSGTGYSCGAYYLVN